MTSIGEGGEKQSIQVGPDFGQNPIRLKQMI